MSVFQGTLEFADSDVFMEYHEWSLLDHSPKMDDNEFTIRETTRNFEIDLDGERVTYQFASAEEQLALNVDVEGWTPEALVLWLDRQVRQMDIHQRELLKWLREAVDYLVIARGIRISSLMRCKFLLARKIQDKISRIRQEERHSIYQRYLFASGSKVEVSFETGFSFQAGMYRDQQRFRGHWKPVKHFLGSDDVPVFYGAEDGEEVQCAQVIDSLTDVAYWIRNVARHPESFWLPTASADSILTLSQSWRMGASWSSNIKGHTSRIVRIQRKSAQLVHYGKMRARGRVYLLSRRIWSMEWTFVGS